MSKTGLEKRMLSIGNGMYLFLHYCLQRPIREFGMIASCMAKLKFILLKGGFTSGKMGEDQKIQLLIQVHLYSGEKNETKKI